MKKYNGDIFKQNRIYRKDMPAGSQKICNAPVNR